MVSMIEGGFVGIVNLCMFELFDCNDCIVVVVVDMIYIDQVEEWSLGFSVIFGDCWEIDVGEFGLLGFFLIFEFQFFINGFQYGLFFVVLNLDVLGIIMVLLGGWQVCDVEIGCDCDSFYVVGQWCFNDGNMELMFKVICVENIVQMDECMIEFFIDVEFWVVWFILEDFSFCNIILFIFVGILWCSGVVEVFFGGIGSCEILIGIDGGLMEFGVVFNNLCDWLGQIGNLQILLQLLVIVQMNEFVM